MSINSMANAAAARRPDMVPSGEVPHTLDQIAMAATTPPTPTEPSVERGQPAAAAAAPVETTLNVLFGYIPTEVLTLYVALIAAVQQEGKVTPADWLVFWSFLFATPVVQWLVYAAKIKALEKPLPLKLSAWPRWEMFAATAAYTAWAFALPHTPFSEYGWYSPAVSGIAVLIVSTSLGLLAPFFQNPLST